MSDADMHDIENDGLIEKMRALANAPASESGLFSEQRANLLTLAFALEQAIVRNDVKGIVSNWAKARRYWCELTGEPLL